MFNHVPNEFDVDLVTKYGNDFPLSQFFEKNKIKMHDPLSSKNATRFKIILNDSDRDLFIENKCEQLEFVDESVSCAIKDFSVFFPNSNRW